jgi:hypothetical protein
LWTKLGWYKPGRKKQHAVVVQRPKIK